MTDFKSEEPSILRPALVISVQYRAFNKHLWEGDVTSFKESLGNKSNIRP